MNLYAYYLLNKKDKQFKSIISIETDAEKKSPNRNSLAPTDSLYKSTRPSKEN